MRKFLLFLFIGVPFAAISQISNSRAQNINPFYFSNDLPVLVDKYPRFADGSPYFSEDWLNGDITITGGKLYENIKVRLDLVDNTLQYISPKGAELVAITPIMNVLLKDSAQKKEYRFVHSSSIKSSKNITTGWYILLVSGPATLYKHISKTIIQPKNISSGATEPTVNTAEEYFIYTDSLLAQVKKTKEIPELLKSKSSELNDYLSKKKLSGKSESNYVEMIRYYNSLGESEKQ